MVRIQASKIRLYGIDAPESKQAFGQKSKQALSAAIAAQNITVIDHGPDIYGRMLGTIWLDGYDINASMVDSGYAWVYRFDGNAIVPNYLKFEASAQKAVKGLWVDPNPVAPREWRQQNQKPQKDEKQGVTAMTRQHPLLKIALNSDGHLSWPILPGRDSPLPNVSATRYYEARMGIWCIRWRRAATSAYLQLLLLFQRQLLKCSAQANVSMLIQSRMGIKP
nr:hypothetical protein [Escherichia coli]